MMTYLKISIQTINIQTSKVDSRNIMCCLISINNYGDIDKGGKYSPNGIYLLYID